MAARHFSPNASFDGGDESSPVRGGGAYGRHARRRTDSAYVPPAPIPAYAVTLPKNSSADEVARSHVDSILSELEAEFAEEARRAAERRRAEEAARLAEERRRAEAARRAEEERRAAEAARLAKERAAEERRRAEEAARLAEERAAEEKRRAEEQKRIEAELAERARREEEERRAAEERAAEERRLQEEARRQEEERAERARLEEEAARAAEEERRAEAARKEQERRAAEEEQRAKEEAAAKERAEEEKRVAEEQRAEEERRLEEARRAEDERRATEAARIAEMTPSLSEYAQPVSQELLADVASEWDTLDEPDELPVALEGDPGGLDEGSEQAPSLASREPTVSYVSPDVLDDEISEWDTLDEPDDLPAMTSQDMSQAGEEESGEDAPTQDSHAPDVAHAPQGDMIDVSDEWDSLDEPEDIPILLTTDPESGIAVEMQVDTPMQVSQGPTGIPVSPEPATDATSEWDTLDEPDDVPVFLTPDDGPALHEDEAEGATEASKQDFEGYDRSDTGAVDANALTAPPLPSDVGAGAAEVAQRTGSWIIKDLKELVSSTSKDDELESTLVLDRVAEEVARVRAEAAAASVPTVRQTGEESTEKGAGDSSSEGIHAEYLVEAPQRERLEVSTNVSGALEPSSARASSPRRFGFFASIGEFVVRVLHLDDR